MKINKVKLYNFSSYEGNNEFDFEITDAEKNIVLIGGKNGAGKTSLFTAIKVALYGPLAYGYVGVNSHYISKIKDLINSKAFQQEIVESEVQILNVLTTEHTGMYESQELCRISSIVGTTEKYFNVNFMDNHKDRVTQFFVIPNDVFGEDQNSLYEFVGRYLNAMSLRSDILDDWAKNGA